MSWQGGRQLASMTDGSSELSFAYNESGLRTEKTVNGVTHSYVWQGSKLAADITDTYALYFHYDSSGEVIGFTMTENGTDTEYFYVKNLQGDVLKVITATGTEAAAYTYDAWGRVLTSTGNMADVNPLRYRGYYYDTETGLYYLQSRYYDPETCRFINADAFASTGQGVLGANMFAYCGNCVVTLRDTAGSIPTVNTIASDSGYMSGTYAGILRRFQYPIINNQNSKYYETVGYGVSNVQYSGCEAIATYNALNLIGTYVPFSDVISTYEEMFLSGGGFFLSHGIFGAMPTDVASSLKRYGVEYSVLLSADEINEPGVYIASYFTPYPTKIGVEFFAVHTICIAYDGSTFCAYNWGGTGDVISSIDKSFICGFYLGQG